VPKTTAKILALIKPVRILKKEAIEMLETDFINFLIN
jgi:hypothetical protein